MTGLAGELITPAEALAGTSGKAALGGELMFAQSGQVAGNHFYKNEGWYATGSVYEEWISSPLPSFSPPSGHTLTFVQFIVLQ